VNVRRCKGGKNWSQRVPNSKEQIVSHRQEFLVESLPKEDVADDAPLSAEWIKEINRRVKDSRDPVRYMLVSEFSRKFILYFDVGTHTFAMNDASRGTLFKRREVAESVKAHLGKGVALVRFTVKGGRLKRLSPFRGMKLRRRRASRIRGRIRHAHKIEGSSHEA
jgi:hypothetical protein